MSEIKATFRIVTPMFLGGTDTTELADTIRPPSVKGALRFWWRALAWSRIRSQCTSDDTALTELHQQEAELFGLAALGTAGGQSQFMLRVLLKTRRNTGNGVVHKPFSQHDGARYLGYGLMEAFASKKKGGEAGQLTRPCINDGQDFEVRLMARGQIDPTLQDALIAWGLLGGLGSRSRHGLGSVALERIDGQVEWTAPRNKKEYQEHITELLKKCPAVSPLPPFTAFSTGAVGNAGAEAGHRIDLLVTAKSSIAAMDAFGRAQMHYRSWGHNGRVLGIASERNFMPDHDWYYNKAPASFHPRRVVFGLPHNYGQNKSQQVSSEHYNRRASPLLFHVHRLSDHEFLGVSALLPAQFLPAGEHIKAGTKSVPQKVEWDVLTTFLDGTTPSADPRFPGKVTIR